MIVLRALPYDPVTYQNLREQLRQMVIGACTECGHTITGLDAFCTIETGERDMPLVRAHSHCIGCNRDDRQRANGCRGCKHRGPLLDRPFAEILKERK